MESPSKDAAWWVLVTGALTGLGSFSRELTGAKITPRLRQVLAAKREAQTSRGTFHVHSFWVHIISGKPPETQGTFMIFEKNDG